MSTLPLPMTLVPNSSYETTRFNALRHGVLSRHTVLPWEDRSEYQTLLDALVADDHDTQRLEHPVGRWA